LKPCQTGSNCFNLRRQNITALFFDADEFQQKAFFVYRLYTAAYGRVPQFSDLMRDQDLLKAFPVDDWHDEDEYLPAQRTFAAQWVQRDSFSRLLPRFDDQRRVREQALRQCGAKAIHTGTFAAKR